MQYTKIGLLAVVAVCMGLGGLGTSAARADTIAYSLDLAGSTPGNLANPPFTLGSEFTTSAAINVTGLGVLDFTGSGNTDSYQVGIWNSSGTLVASGTVASGITDPLINGFRYVSIIPVLLASGTYDIGALYLDGNDSLIFPGNASGFSTAADITFDESRFASGGTLTNPTISSGTDPSYFGPNFEFEAASAVPEPASLTLFGAALLGLGLMRRRKRPS